MKKQFKKIPIGNSNFQKIIERGDYYIDKSLLIKELLDSGSEVTLKGFRNRKSDRRSQEMV